MLEYNKIINDIMFTQSESLFLFIIFALLFSLAFDAVIGELPGRIHPVVIIGSIINFLRDFASK